MQFVIISLNKKKHLQSLPDWFCGQICIKQMKT